MENCKLNLTQPSCGVSQLSVPSITSTSQGSGDFAFWVCVTLYFWKCVRSCTNTKEEEEEAAAGAVNEECRTQTEARDERAVEDTD